MAEIIRSNAIREEVIPIGSEAGMLEVYDGLKTPVSEDIIELTPYHTSQIEAYVNAAAMAFGPHGESAEPTFAQTRFGVPALVVRVDCTIRDGEIVAYEMEDSPSGQGVTDKVHKSMGGVGIKNIIRDHYYSSIGQLPHVVVSGARSHGTDDPLIVGAENYTYDTRRDLQLPEDKLVIVKSIPGFEESSRPYEHLQSRALAPLQSEGDKTYLERMKQLRSVSDERGLLQTPNGELASQVLKARMGSMAMGVSLYLHPVDRHQFGKKGIVTASRLVRDLHHFKDSRDGALVQPFVAPMQLKNNEGRSNAIMRVFALLKRQDGEIVSRVIGGCYVARPELIVHGAQNAVSGAVVIGEHSS